MNEECNSCLAFSSLSHLNNLHKSDSIRRFSLGSVFSGQNPVFSIITIDFFYTKYGNLFDYYPHQIHVNLGHFELRPLFDKALLYSTQLRLWLFLLQKRFACHWTGVVMMMMMQSSAELRRTKCEDNWRVWRLMALLLSMLGQRKK